VATQFTSYAFKSGAIGSPSSDTRVARTLPDRLSKDIVNVKDWGATGNGITDDTDAINAAIDHAYTLGFTHPQYTFFDRHGAIIFFPPGIYIIGKGGTTKLRFDRYNGGRFAQFRYIGSGRDVTILRGTYSTGHQMDSRDNGFLVEANAWQSQVLELRDLAIENMSTDTLSGAFMSLSGPTSVMNCRFKGVLGYYSGAVAFGGNVSNCIFECSRPITAASAASRSPHFVLSSFGEALTNGSVGAFFGQGSFSGCLAIGFDVGIIVALYGGRLVSCKAYRCGVGILGGYAGGDPTGGGNVGGADQGPPLSATWGYGSTGWVHTANWCDRCTWGIYLGAVNIANHIGANSVTGDTGPTEPAGIDSITWSSANGGTATVNTHDAHNLPSGTNKLVLVTNVPGWTPGNTGNEIVTCNNTGTSQFTYALSSNPGGTGSGTWNYPIEYGIRVDAPNGQMFSANVLDAVVSVASFDITMPRAMYTGHNVAAAMRGSWSLEDSHRIAGWKFIQCGTVANHPRSIAFAELPPQPDRSLFSNYPYWLLAPVEGDEFNVTDCAAQANFAGTVTGGGSNRYKVRYDGTNWIRVG